MQVTCAILKVLYLVVNYSTSKADRKAHLRDKIKMLTERQWQ
jgi:hypothetical protein